MNTKAWRQALDRAGIQDFRWHDLRHTWASWHVQNGTPLFAQQELGGWQSSEMARRYAHLSAEHLTPYADRLCALRVVEDPAGGHVLYGTVVCGIDYCAADDAGRVKCSTRPGGDAAMDA
jgi:hypothetical protein